MNESIELYEEAALTIDLPEEHLKAGDVGLVVEIMPHPDGGPRGVILEVFSALNHTIAVVVVPETHVQPLTDDEVWAVRRVAHQRAPECS